MELFEKRNVHSKGTSMTLGQQDGVGGGGEQPITHEKVER
jgi:hypothetical protein